MMLSGGELNQAFRALSAPAACNDPPGASAHTLPLGPEASFQFRVML